MRMPGRARKIIGLMGQHLGTPAAGVEVGVQFGKTANALLSAYPGLVLYLVDCYDNAVSIVHHKWSPTDVQDYARKLLGKYGSRAIWLESLSVMAARSVPDYNLDFAFIDAAHDYESVKADIRAWTLKVRKWGLMMGHDYTRRFEGVRRAVTEAFCFDGFGHVGDIWWHQVTGLDVGYSARH